MSSLLSRRSSVAAGPAEARPGRREELKVLREVYGCGSKPKVPFWGWLPSQGSLF